MKKFQNKKSGFSMLELVVVMLIMGTLAGIRISKMGGSDVGAIKASVKSDIRGVIASINSCYADKLDYRNCDTIAELTPRPVSSRNNTITITRLARTDTPSNFPLIQVSNSVIDGGYSLYYDSDVHSGISTSATNQRN
ncbi:type IV pilin protein [Aliarcobacter butzleri]